MGEPNPLDTVKNLIDAINQGDLDRALSFYEPNAILIAQPGTIARGRDAVRAAPWGIHFFEAFT
jgi:ketosteroid isomerase-like protein